MPTPPRRRWFLFGLRTLLILVTVSSWLGYHLNWIRQRHAFLAAYRDLPTRSVHLVQPGTCGAPGQLPLFGESGVKYIQLAKRHEAAVRRLFPEAEIGISPGWERSTKDMKRINETVPGYYVLTQYDE